MDIQIKPRDVLPADAVTLPARYYTDPDVFARELERIWSRFWIAAARAPELAEPGDYVLRAIAGDSFLVVRGDDGAVRAFWNVCRHRGTRLCTEPEGRWPGRIQCPYHAWTYALDGRLAAAPHMDDVPHFRKEDFPLVPLACDVWDGHVFVRLAADGPPLEAHVAGLAAKFRPWDMARLRRARRIVYDVRANWKLILQNYSECLHCPTLHPALNRLSHYLSGENEPLQPTYMGGRMDLRPGVETMSMDGVRRRACLPDVPPEDRRRVYYYAIFPNFLLTLHPDYMMTHTLWPHAVDRTEIVCEWHFAPEELARPDFDPSDVVSFWDLTNRQDWQVCELAQSGIGSRGYRPGPYSNREDLLYAFDRFIVGLIDGA
ncbi:MAG TPA: aromatic ring-hydroxylating dioxygenase subunit alpha [Vicinamibacterales bacterium]|nr:aromatic ring-hydroxylating dioxygenase subunit alpha [Vicinamibacterales bacterium]